VTLVCWGCPVLGVARPLARSPARPLARSGSPAQARPLARADQPNWESGTLARASTPLLKQQGTISP
jgi:hypothetical protein